MKTTAVLSAVLTMKKFEGVEGKNHQAILLHWGRLGN